MYNMMGALCGITQHNGIVALDKILLLHSGNPSTLPKLKASEWIILIFLLCLCRLET